MILASVLAFMTLVVVVILLPKFLKAPAPIVILLATVAAGLAGGIGMPLVQYVEGTFGFFYIILVFGCGLILVKVMAEIGFNEAIQAAMLTHLGGNRILLMLCLMGLLMLPGMLTGIGSVAVLSTGAVAAAVLLGLGVPKPWTAVFIATGAILGMVAPPVNLLLMYIGTIIALPYSGFTGILLLLTVPLAIGVAVWTALRFRPQGTPDAGLNQESAAS